MSDQRSSTVTLDDVADAARTAWNRLRDELRAILGDDLLAMWAYGGTIAAGRQPRAADLDTYVIVNRRPDEATAQRIEAAHDAIAQEQGVAWDVWYVLADDARRPDAPRHAYRERRRDTSWAINRAHWLAGRYVHLFGREPAEIVPAPTRPELDVDLRRELEHIERHIVEGDTNLYEATYAILNGSRILHSFQTGDVAISKREAGAWASSISLPAGMPLFARQRARTPARRRRKTSLCWPPRWPRSSRWSGSGCPRPSMSPQRRDFPGGRVTDADVHIGAMTSSTCGTALSVLGSVIVPSRSQSCTFPTRRALGSDSEACR